MGNTNNSELVQQTVVERAKSEGGIWDQTWTLIELHWTDLLYGVPAILLTILLVELTKGWLKKIAAYKLADKYDDELEALIVHTWTVPCAFLWVMGLHFTEVWNSILPEKMQLSWWFGPIVGTTLTAGAAIGIVKAADYFNVAQTLRVRWRRFTKVTKEDIKSAQSTAVHTLKDLNPDYEAPEDKDV